MYVLGGSKISFLDTEEKSSSINECIEVLFKVYSHYVEKGNNSITFKPDQIKTRDLLGWTEVKSIERKTFKCDEMLELKANGKSVVTSPGILIPLFNPEVKQKGFHGDIKYQFRLYDLFKEDLSFAQKNSKFNKIRLNNVDNPFVDFTIEPFEHSKEYTQCNGYSIITKSGWIDINGILLYSKPVNLEKVILEDYFAYK